MRPETRDVLELWVETANQLRSWSLWQGFQKGDDYYLSFQLDRDPNTLTELAYGGPLPQGEAMAATLLKVRLLQQRQEEFSLRRLEEVSNDPSLSESWRQGFAQTQSSIDDLMNSSCEIPQCVSPRTTKRIFDVFSFGGGAHYNQRSVLKEWESSSHYPLLQWLYVGTVAQLCCHILNLAELAERELSLTPPTA